MPEENIIKLRHFFEADLAIKRLMYTMAPSSNNCADIIQYSDQLEGMINYITSEIEEFSIDIFNSKELQDKAKSFCSELTKAFHKCSIDQLAYKKFYQTYISDMSPEFVESVKTNIKGYYSASKPPVEEVHTVNEFLHLMHSAIVNDEKIYNAFPVVSQITNDYNYHVSYRGELSPAFSNLFSQFPKELDVGWTDLLCVSENRLIMMVRDRGHALTMEITISGSTAIVDYFVPRILDKEMVSNLPGVNKFNESFAGATGKFTVPVNDLPNSIYTFISMVPNEKIVDMKNDSPIR